MSMTSHKTLAGYAEHIGFEPTIALASFFGAAGKNLHIPMSADPDHIIAKVIGLEAFTRLVEVYGGERISIPQLEISPMRNAGRVWLLNQRNISASASASLLGLSVDRVRQINSSLRREGFFDLADQLDEIKSEGGA